MNVFINKVKIDELYNEEKYKNCMEKKYFEYIVSTGNIDYIDKYLNDSKHKKLIENLIDKNKVIKVIDKLSVTQNKKRHIGELQKSGINNIEVSDELVERYSEKLLLDGIFALITLEENMDEEYPYYIEEIEILEDIDVNLDEYREYFEKAKEENSLEINNFEGNSGKFKAISEIDLVLNTIGISTKELTFWEKILFLVRLIPLCEANYNLMEMGGNGIGKTKTYSMFSPECEIVQEMLITELIYNRQSNEKGLLDTKDVIVFDEINKIKIDSNNEKIIPQLLNFMADGQTTSPRKVISKTSLVFSGNAMGIQERIEKNEKNIFDSSHKLEDNAFLDRIHFFLPAWGLRRYSKNVHGLNIQKKVFRFDYFSKALSRLREEDYSKILDQKGYRLDNGSEREIKAIRKTVSGLIKLTHPNREIDDFILEAYIAIAIKGRGLINKFLHNKNKNNINEIDIKVIRTIKSANGFYREFEIPVNELLKRMIYTDNFDEINCYLTEKIQKQNQYVSSYNSYSYSCDKYLNRFDINPYDKGIFQGEKLYEGKYYPNRYIIPLSNVNGSHIIFIKVALDKLGIQKNKREYKIMKKEYEFINSQLKGNDGRVLIIEAINHRIDKKSPFYNKEEYIEKLCDDFEFNYDGLFGGEALDHNEFNNLSIGFDSRFELDNSNIYEMNLIKKIKCEHCGKEIIPKYMYKSILKNDNNRNMKNDFEKFTNTESYYYYECDDKTNSPPYKSKPMNYIEFKYFLKENGVIDF